MDSQKLHGAYDAYYFAHGCGRPYERDDEWLRFFGGIADRIVEEIQPASVLDAGCALAFLVESLRDRGVEAFGVDISEYAISQVREDIKPYCWVGSVAEPFPRHYDLIVCIEVLEHMSQREAEEAVANFCRYSDDILFSSTPFDYKEATHFNVQPPEYWAALFARHGFYRDVDFDGTFITPQTVLFVRRDAPTHRLVRDYERKFWLLWKENADLRSLTLEMRNQLAADERTVASLNEHIAGLNVQLQAANAQLQATNAQLQAANAQVAVDNVHIESLYDQIAWRDKQIAEHKQRVSEAVQVVNNVNRQIAEKDRQLADRDRQLRQKNQGLATAKRHIDKLEAAITRKNEHIAYLEQLIKQIESGRVMKLMRTARHLLRPAPVPPPSAPASPVEEVEEPELEAPQEEGRDPYQVWIAENEPGPAELGRQRQDARAFGYRPLLSVITPVYNPDPQVLREAIESVVAQTYDHWELCLVDGNSDKPGVKNVLSEYAQRDNRIRVTFLDRNLRISGNSNEALRMAAGEFVVLLDHDDLLAPDMLYEVVKLLNERPDADVIYYDEDKVSDDGRQRRYPWFKPNGWSPDLLLSTNYLMHSVIRRTLLVGLGGFDPEMDGAQDWDLALRLGEKTKNIVHIPRVFYHWRQVEGSAARDASAKPWAFAAQERCIKAHLQRIGDADARVVFPSLGRVRVIWPTSGAKASIIIPTKDKVDLLRACLSSITQRTSYANYEIVVVDTGSSQQTTRDYYAELADDPRVRIVEYSGPFNYSTVNNLGARHASGDVFVFLNNDTEVLEADWLDELVGWAERPEVGVVGCKLLRPDGTIQHAGIVMGVEGHGSHIFDGDHEDTYGPFGSSEWYRDYMAVTGACMTMRRELFERLDGFDEAYYVGYGDLDICLRARELDYRVVYTPFARLLHHEGGTRGFSLPPADVLRASMRMLPLIQSGDPFFNRNLSYMHRRPTIVQPGEEHREERLLEILRSFGLIEGFDLLPPLMSGSTRQFLGNAEDQPADKQRILFVTHDLSLSGAPLILCKLAIYLSQAGYNITVLSPIDGPLHGLYADANIPVILEPAALEDARVVFTMLQDYSAVLANTITAWRVVYGARALGAPCMWWIHEGKLGQQLMRNNPIIAQALSAADAVIFPSKATSSLYTEFAPRARFFPIHPGLDLEGGDGIADAFPKQPGKFYLVNVGSIEPRKGQDVLLRAVASLPEDVRQNLEIYLVGRVLDWSFYADLTRKTERMRNIHIVGEVPHEKVKSYLQAADAFVFPSRDEALPLSVLEAMYYGKGIITTNVGGVAEVVEDGIHGYVVDIEDHEALAQSLQRLLADRELLQRMGANARAKFDEYLTLSRFGEEVGQLISQVAGAELAGSSSTR